MYLRSEKEREGDFVAQCKEMNALSLPLCILGLGPLDSPLPGLYLLPTARSAPPPHAMGSSKAKRSKRRKVGECEAGTPFQPVTTFT